MKRYAWLVILAAVLCFSGTAYAAALTTAISVGTATHAAGGVWTQEFQWQFNPDNAALSAVFDVSKCVQPITIAFDPDTTGANDTARAQVYVCNESTSAIGSGCVAQGPVLGSMSATGWMPSRDYIAFYPSTSPGAGDFATVTLSCATDGYIYDPATSAWVVADNYAGTQTAGALRQNVSVYYNDFITGFSSLEPGDDIDETNEWTAVDIGTVTEDPSIAVLDDEPNGVLWINTDATIGDGMSILLNASTTNGHALVPAAGRTIYAEFRVKSSDISAQHFFVGLNETSAAAVVATAGTMNGSLEYAGFHHEGAVDTAGLPALTVAGGNNTQVESTYSTTTTAQADNTYATYAIKIVGVDTIYYYINNALVGQNVAVDDFTAAMYPAVAAVNDEAVDDTFYVDYIYVSQTR